ncbi:unnamed protein product [Closterium sp. Yama58-4]|nr:unnamed protein product [Closterium sp. Yama58-4]
MPHCYPCLLPTPHPQAREIVVGGSKKWTFGISTWKPKSTAKAGDVLVFKWSGFHDVWQMSTVAAYKACDFQAAEQKAPAATGTTYSFTVPSTAAGSILYFACGVPGHCAGKMKVALSVKK